MIPRLLRVALLLLTLALVAFGWGQMPSAAPKWSATVEPAKAAPGGRVELVLRAEIPEPWHLYSLTKDMGPFPTTITPTKDASVAEVGKPTQQEPQRQKDPSFDNKEVEFYEKQAEFRVPFRLAKTASGSVKLEARVQFQLCNEGQCTIPPGLDEAPKVSATVEVSGAAVDDKTPLDQSAAPVAATTEDKAAAAPVNDVERAKAQGLFAYIAVAAGFGFASLLTPCVFPMIPITVSFFSKRRGDDGMRGTFRQAAAYCIGIVGTFTALGVAVALIFGATGLTTFANNPYLNLGLAVVFVALAFSLFGFFEIGVPSSILTKLDGSGKGGLIGPVLMGLTFSLTSFTCTLPFVGAVLVSASQGEVWWSVLGMLVFSSAFCLPFFLLALFPAALSKLPRSGAWLATVKAFMGFVELAAAVKFVSSVDLGIVPGGLGIITREVFLAIWFGIAVLTAFYLLGIVRLPKIDEGKFGILRYATGAAALVGAGYLLVAINGRSIGQLESFLPPSPYPGREGKTAERLAWHDDYDKAVAEAKATGKPLFIDFTGIYCTNCRDMERNMFPRPEVESRLEKFVRVRLFTDQDKPQDKANQKLLQKMTNSVTLPSYVVVDPVGTPNVGAWTRSEAEFTAFLDKGLGQGLSARR